jgi:hypothetical protein
MNLVASVMTFVLTGVGVAEGVAVGVAEGVAVGVGVGVGVVEVVGVGIGVATFTPLLQTSFLPDLTQVYLKPLATEVEFNLEQVAPVFTAANAGAESIEANKDKQSKNNIDCIDSRFTNVIFDSP